MKLLEGEYISLNFRLTKHERTVAATASQYQTVESRVLTKMIIAIEVAEAVNDIREGEKEKKGRLLSFPLN